MSGFDIILTLNRAADEDNFRLIKEYGQLYVKIKNRAIYINDMLAHMDAAEHLKMYRPKHIGCTSIDHVDVNLQEVILSRTDDFDYTTTWTIDAAYIEMPDEDVKTHYKRKMQSMYDSDKHRTLRKMEKDAKMFGYKLVKEGE